MKSILRLGAVLLFFICIFPPWVQDDHHGIVRGSEPLGYSWIFRPPQPKDGGSNQDPWRALPSLPEGYEEISANSFARKGIAIRLDLSRLSFEILALIALVGLSLTFTRKARV